MIKKIPSTNGKDPDYLLNNTEEIEYLQKKMKLNCCICEDIKRLENSKTNTIALKYGQTFLK